jgi:hypothetical protein
MALPFHVYWACRRAHLLLYPAPHMKFGVSLIVLLLSLLTWTSDAAAYAWMIRHGYAKCGTCHTDPSGGETLSHMGRVTSETLLSQAWGEEQSEPTNATKLLFGIPEPDVLRIGGSVRGMGIYDVESAKAFAFPMQADVYGTLRLGGVVVSGSVGMSRASGRLEHTDKAVLVGDLQDDRLVAVSRNHWLGYQFDSHVLVRAGRIGLPFGLRIPEHTQWVRDATLTDRESDQQHGLAIAYWGGSFRGELMGVAGNFQLPRADTRELGYAGFLEYLFDSHTALGVSSQYLFSKVGLYSRLSNASRQAHGLTFRYSPFHMLVVMAEADVLMESERALGYVGMLVADVEPTQGLHLVLTGEALNRGARKEASETPAGAPPIPEDASSSAGNGAPRFGGWGSILWFPYPHIDMRVDAVARSDRSLQLQLITHLYF